jgi:RNA polymerase sigma-70 factor (ECF subfamily)
MSPEIPRPDSEETERLLDLVQAGDRDALGQLLAQQRDRLRGFIDIHLDRPLRARVDPSDALQDTLYKVADRINDFLARRPMPFRLWVLRMARELVANLRRHHYAGVRDIRREADVPDSSAVALANRMVGGGPTPSEMAEARERAAQVAQAVEQLDCDDREILLLRLVDDLKHDEIADMLEISSEAVRQRYGRALVKLEQSLVTIGITGGAS